MSQYSEFFLSSKSSIVQLELLEISHPNFSEVFRIVRNAVAGVDVVLETGVTETFNYRPLKIKGIGTRDNLDFGLVIDLGDLGEVLPKELDLIVENNGLIHLDCLP